MADGSLCVYTSEKNFAEMEFVLECTQEQLQEIEKAVHFGELFFTGMRAGSFSAEKPQAFGAWINGNTESERVSLHLWKVTIPLTIQLGKDCSPEIFRIPEVAEA